MVPGWTQFEPTIVQLCTVTGELAPLKSKGMLAVTGREVSVSSGVDSCCTGPVYPGVGLCEGYGLSAGSGEGHGELPGGHYGPQLKPPPCLQSVLSLQKYVPQRLLSAIPPPCSSPCDLFLATSSTGPFTIKGHSTPALLSQTGDEGLCLQ